MNAKLFVVIYLTYSIALILLGYILSTFKWRTRKFANK